MRQKQMNNYTDMTDEEYDALDEEMTRNPPRLAREEEENEDENE